jgi:hypothetical protein
MFITRLGTLAACNVFVWQRLDCVYLRMRPLCMTMLARSCRSYELQSTDHKCIVYACAATQKLKTSTVITPISFLGCSGPTPRLSSAALMREAAARSQLQDGVLQLDLLCERAGVHEGLNASADSFFSSQGRPDPNFDDRNSNVIDQLLAMHPHASSLEMETFHLLHLSSCSRGRSCPSSPATAIPCI